jgi:hypothetical protein
MFMIKYFLVLFPSSPSILIKTSSGDIKAKEGDVVNLLCSAQGELPITFSWGKPEATGKFYGKGKAPLQFFTCCNSERSNKFRKIYLSYPSRFGSTTSKNWVHKLNDAGSLAFSTLL